MRFVAAGPPPLLKSASEQLLKAEKLRMAQKEAVKEEEGAAWQNNLDNWKSSRRKRQEDVIERLTEVKKMEELDHDRARRRSKTFGEMMQDRSGERRSRRVLQVFTEDDNDISSLLSSKSPTSSDTKSDLGFATSSDTGSEPSDQQESADKLSVASPSGAEHNGHDSGTDEYTYDSAIQGYIKFAAEKTRPSEALSAAAATAAPPDETARAGRAEPAPVRTGRPSVVLRDKKTRVDVHKRRSLFEERPGSEEPTTAAMKRQHRKSFDLGDSLRHRIASLETVAGAGGGDAAAWRAPVKGDHFMQKLAMFSSMDGSREATVDRRASPDTIPRQKSASDIRSKFEQMAAEEQRAEQRALERRPSGPGGLESGGSERLDWRGSGAASLDRYPRPASAQPAATTSAGPVSITPEPEPRPQSSAQVSPPKRAPPVPMEIHIAGSKRKTKPDTSSQPAADPSVAETRSCTPNDTAPPRNNHHDTTHASQSDTQRRSPSPTPKQPGSSQETPSLSAPEPAAPAAGGPDSSGAETGSSLSSHAVDQMEAQILRQLEESERSQMSAAAEMPVVLDFPLVPSAAPPPREKPPPPPPADEDDDQAVVRPAKTTTAVKKDLYRRRSDFLGIQPESAAEPVVARPPDMETLLRQERAQQQEQQQEQQERRRRSEQQRRESLRLAEEEAEARAEQFRLRAQAEKEQRDQERREAEQRLQEQERLQEEEQMRLDQERRAQEQERRSQQEQERRAQEHHQQQQQQSWAPEPVPQERLAQEEVVDQERLAQEEVVDQEREWRRRKELLSEEDVDRQERAIMESLEQEESWRHRQQIKYQSRLARMAAQEQTWQQTQEAPPAGGERRATLPPDLRRQQARSNPNLLQDAAPARLAGSRSHSDLVAPPAAAAADNHGQHPQQQQQQQQQQRHPGNYAHQAAPTKPQRAAAEQDARVPAPSATGRPPPAAAESAPPGRTSRSHTLPAAAEQPAPPGSMSRHTLQSLSAAPRSNLRQDWMPRKRADAPRNIGQHWLIQEAEQRRISDQQERASRQHQTSPYQPTQTSPPGHPQPQQLQQPQLPHGHPQPQQPQQHHQPPPQQHPAYYSHNQPIYENTPAQLNGGSVHYQDISEVRPTYGSPAYPQTQSAEPEAPRPERSERTTPADDRVLSVSGRKKCSHCGDELGRGAAMIIESLRLFYHINCFKCCVCNVQLGNGSMGADVRVRNNKLHCHDCYSNDEGLKFSKV